MIVLKFIILFFSMIMLSILMSVLGWIELITNILVGSQKLWKKLRNQLI